MKFALLLYGDHAVERALDRAASSAIVEAHNGFGTDLDDAGADVCGAALDWPDTAATVHENGIVTDGPFAEAREQIGGIYVIDVVDKEAALWWAKQVPASPDLTVEVRPLLSFDDDDDPDTGGAGA